MTLDVDGEVAQLVEELRRLGEVDSDGQIRCKFGKLFEDERCQNVFEALIGTLRAAKKRKVVDYEGQMLLKGVHDDVDIILCKG